jgi:hypothetical protein
MGICPRSSWTFVLCTDLTLGRVLGGDGGESLSGAGWSWKPLSPQTNGTRTSCLLVFRSYPLASSNEWVSGGRMEGTEWNIFTVSSGHRPEAAGLFPSIS